MLVSIVDYIKAQINDAQGDVTRKEYYMREFGKKLGNESNKRKTSMSFLPHHLQWGKMSTTPEGESRTLHQKNQLDRIYEGYPPKNSGYEGN